MRWFQREARRLAQVATIRRECRRLKHEQLQILEQAAGETLNAADEARYQALAEQVARVGVLPRRAAPNAIGEPRMTDFPISPISRTGQPQ